MSFLDEHCIIFDTEDENKLEYTVIHSVYLTAYYNPLVQNFKKLVEELLGELMAELGVT